MENVLIRALTQCDNHAKIIIVRLYVLDRTRGTKMNKFLGFIIQLGEDIYQAQHEGITTLFDKYEISPDRNHETYRTAKSNFE